MYLLLQDVNNRENCRVAEAGGRRRYMGTLCAICSIFCKPETAPKIILLIFFNDMFHYKKQSTFKVISNIPQRSLGVPAPRVFCHLSGHMPSP